MFNDDDSDFVTGVKMVGSAALGVTGLLALGAIASSDEGSRSISRHMENRYQERELERQQRELEREQRELTRARRRLVGASIRLPARKSLMRTQVVIFPATQEEQLLERMEELTSDYEKEPLLRDYVRSGRSLSPITASKVRSQFDYCNSEMEQLLYTAVAA